MSVRPNDRWHDVLWRFRRTDPPRECRCMIRFCRMDQLVVGEARVAHLICPGTRLPPVKDRRRIGIDGREEQAVNRPHIVDFCKNQGCILGNENTPAKTTRFQMMIGRCPIVHGLRRPDKMRHQVKLEAVCSRQPKGVGPCS